MQKKFYGNLVLIVLLNVLVKPFYLFAIDAQVQNTVGPEDYGIYFSLLNFSFLFNMFLDIGITNYNTKNIAQHPNTVAKYIGSILGLKFVLGIVYFAITIGTALLLGYGNFEMHLLTMLVLNQFLAGLLLYFRSNFAGLHLFKIDAVLSVLDRLLLIVICAVLLYSSFVTSPFQIEWFVYAQTFTYGITVLIALIISFVKIGKIRFSFNRLFSTALLKKSTPYALLILLMMLYTRLDAVMLERILPDGKEQAGIYAQGFRLLDAVNMFAFLVAGLLLPIFARQIKLKESIVNVLQPAGMLLISVALLVGISAAFSAKPLMNLIYHQEISASSRAFSWIILSFIPMSTGYVFGSLLTANGSMKILNRMALFGIVINVVANFILIPVYKAEGAAIATFFTQLGTALAQVFIVLSVFKLKVHFTHTLRLAILAVVMVISGYLSINLELGAWQFVVLISLGVLFIFGLRIINIKEIIQFLLKK
ncbi:MAG: oligosaccharide flippase family protein [Brumimicrobium sp.]